MSEQRQTTTGPWVVDVRDLGRRPGSSRAVHRTAPTSSDLGIADVIGVPRGVEVELDILLESVVEGVLVSGTAAARASGMCSRCLEPVAERIEVELTELFAYPESATEATTDADEVSRLVHDLINMEPVVRDAVVLALPLVPLCSPDCAGLCPDCGGRWAELGPDHRHETIDPRWAALTERLDMTDEQ